MNLEEEIANELSNQISKTIDFQILAEMLVSCGWTKIELPSKWLPVSGIELHDWREKNLTGAWKAHENIWVFEKSEDALVFTLKWL